MRPGSASSGSPSTPAKPRSRSTARRSRTTSSSRSSATRSRSRAPSRPRSAAGFRSVNVALRQALDLYANLRPARSMKGLDTRYEDVDLVIVRENTEDLYAGHRAHGRPRRRREHQDHHPGRLGTDRPVRLRLRRGEWPTHGHRGPQGEHHEAVRRPLPRELSDGRRGLRGPDRVRGSHRRQHVHAARPEARAVRRPRPAEPVRRHRQRPGGRAGRWARRRAGRQHRHRRRRLRAGPRLRARSTPARTRRTRPR